MKFITDENIPISLVNAIRQKGHSVKDIKEEKLQGVKDSAIMLLSREEKRIIITLDKDFATYPLESHRGVILLRYKNKNSYNLIAQFNPFLDSHLIKEVENTLCEVFDTHIKIHKR